MRLVVGTLLLIFGLIYAYGRAAAVNGTLESGTRDAARSATIARSYDEAVDRARDVVREAILELPRSCQNSVSVQVSNTFDPGEPVTVDVGVKRGVVVTGRVVDKGTGKPVPGVVWVGVLVDNPFAKDFPEFGSSSVMRSEYTADDGTFRIVTIPGPVILMGGPDTRRTPDGYTARFRYRPPVPDPNHPRYFPKERGGLDNAYYTLSGGFSPIQGNFCKVLEIKPGAGVVTTRAHVHFVVTEHGVADLHGRTLRQRAAALVAVAAPQHREALAAAAHRRLGAPP